MQDTPNQTTPETVSPQWVDHLKATEAEIVKDAEKLDELLKEELVNKPKSLIAEVEDGKSPL